MKDEQKVRSGIASNLIRMSVGIENMIDLIEDTDRALHVLNRSK